MKIEIEYKYNDSANYPCRVVANLPGGHMAVGIGRTWEDAKDDCLKAAKNSSELPAIRAKETVEVE